MKEDTRILKLSFPANRGEKYGKKKKHILKILTGESMISKMNLPININQTKV